MPNRESKIPSFSAIRISVLCLTIVAGTIPAVSEKTIEGRNGVSLPAPPTTATDTVIDNLHGTEIADPYRWLENAKSPETRA